MSVLAEQQFGIIGRGENVERRKVAMERAGREAPARLQDDRS